MRTTVLAGLGAAILGLSGCQPAGDDPLVIATSWTRAARNDLETLYHQQSGDPRAITWVVLEAGARPSSVLDRRGGVDVVLGGPAAAWEPSNTSTNIDVFGSTSEGVRHPGSRPRRAGWRTIGDPRDDPRELARARGLLRVRGWASGYEALVRQAAGGASRVVNEEGLEPGEDVGLVRTGRHPAKARRFLAILQARGWIEPSTPDRKTEAMADALLADLLGSSLVDARPELREAARALERFGHPARAESAIGERPPWPPASVARLQASPEGGPLLETLAEQVAPDPRSRAWLLQSWSGPRRSVDGALLDELARAVDGRLAREPRFRAWLRGEWTAWNRQLYRRVARVAGGYVPS